MTTTGTKIINSQALSGCLMFQSAQVSVFQVNVPRWWRLATEVFICNFNQVQFSYTATAVINRAGDYLASAFLAGKFLALSAGDGDLTEEEARASYINMPIVGCWTECRFATPTDTIERLWPVSVMIIMEFASHVSQRMAALVGDETTALKRIQNATQDMVYMVLLPFATSRNLALAFMISAALLSPPQIEVDLTAFSTIAYSEQHVGSNPVAVEQAASATATLSLWLVCIFYQITKDERSYIISLAMEVLLTLGSRYTQNTVSASQNTNTVTHQIQSVDQIRCIALFSRNQDAVKGGGAAGHMPFAGGVVVNGKPSPIVQRSQVYLDGEKGGAAQTPQINRNIAAYRQGALDPRRYVSLVAMFGKAFDAFSPGTCYAAALDSLQVEVDYVGASDDQDQDSDASSNIQHTYYAWEYDVWKYSGSQFYRIWCN